MNNSKSLSASLGKLFSLLAVIAALLLPATQEPLAQEKQEVTLFNAFGEPSDSYCNTLGLHSLKDSQNKMQGEDWKVVFRVVDGATGKPLEDASVVINSRRNCFVFYEKATGMYAPVGAAPAPMKCYSSLNQKTGLYDYTAEIEPGNICGVEYNYKDSPALASPAFMLRPRCIKGSPEDAASNNLRNLNAAIQCGPAVKIHDHNEKYRFPQYNQRGAYFEFHTLSFRNSSFDEFDDGLYKLGGQEYGLNAGGDYKSGFRLEYGFMVEKKGYKTFKGKSPALALVPSDAKGPSGTIILRDIILEPQDSDNSSRVDAGSYFEVSDVKTEKNSAAAGESVNVSASVSVPEIYAASGYRLPGFFLVTSAEKSVERHLLAPAIPQDGKYSGKLALSGEINTRVLPAGEFDLFGALHSSSVIFASRSDLPPSGSERYIYFPAGKLAVTAAPPSAD